MFWWQTLLTNEYGFHWNISQIFTQDVKVTQNILQTVCRATLISHIIRLAWTTNFTHKFQKWVWFQWKISKLWSKNVIGWKRSYHYRNYNSLRTEHSDDSFLGKIPAERRYWLPVFRASPCYNYQLPVMRWWLFPVSLCEYLNALQF